MSLTGLSRRRRWSAPRHSCDSEAGLHAGDHSRVDSGHEGVTHRDRHSGVELVDAVAASTSSGAPYRIGDGLYIDGGYRRNENADLALGYERVLVLSPLGGRTRHPLEWGMQLAAQVDELRAAGSAVETVLPDGDSLAAFGDNLMDLSVRAPAAQAGYHQGRRLAERTEF